ncbi:MAG TPA: glycosyltransferase family 39 protein, partial [Coleofasciculaceae cyanobacterium]
MARLEKTQQPEDDQLEDEQPDKRRSPSRWLRYSVIALVMLGVFFRFYQLDEKVYWLDEARTSLRMSGHTQTEFIQEVYQGQVIDMATLQRYQSPSADADWGDTLQALRGNAEHTPLYFLLARLWTQIFGYSVTSIRSLSAVLSLLVFPCMFWLTRELFEPQVGRAVAWVGLAIVAVSPLHVLYAQEARPYSLWTVLTLLSSAVLLWAMRSPHRHRWIAYGATVALGLYTQLLFV